MKDIFILLICAVAFTACKKNNAVETNIVASEAATDSLQTPIDSLETDSTLVEPPGTVDELFADFIYSYSSNKAFQYSRTRFPLKRNFSGMEAKPVSRDKWKFDRLYYRTELHLIILDSEKALDDIDVMHSNPVDVEYVRFGEESVKQYVFDKTDGKWELARLNYFPIAQHADAEFLEFYGNFANDSAFQRKHVAEFVDFVTYDEFNDNEKIEGAIDIDQWYAFHPEMPAGNVFVINYGQKLTNPNTRVVSIRGNSNSWSSMFKFKKKDGVWKLVKFEN